MGRSGPWRESNDDASDTATYGFVKKSPVIGNWTHSRSDLLTHFEQCKEHSSPVSVRSDKVNARFEQIVSHMANQKPQQRSDFGSIKALGTAGQGVSRIFGNDG